MAQPMMAQPIGGYPGMVMPGLSKWSTGFCDCCGQPGGICLCCKAAWCPCIMYGEIANRLTTSEALCAGSGESSACAVYCGADYLPPFVGCPSLGFILHCQARQSVRQRYGIVEDPCCDCCVAFCCAACSFVQIHKELALKQAPIVVNGMMPMQPMPGYAPVAGGVPVVVAQPVNHMH